METPEAIETITCMKRDFDETLNDDQLDALNKAIAALNLYRSLEVFITEHPAAASVLLRGDRR